MVIYCVIGLPLLQNQAAQKEGEESKRIFHQAFEMFKASAALLHHDAFTARTWGDALHDCSKKLIQEAEDPDTPPKKREELLNEASEMLTQASLKFETALQLRNDYTNAMNNWALSLSTHAKILPAEKSEELFCEAYNKFEKALKMTDTDESFILCNWAMTLVSQARKRANMDLNTNSNNLQDSNSLMLLQEAKHKLLTQIEKGDTWALFCLARCCSVANEVEECCVLLTKFQATENYLPRATRGQMAYFKNVCHYDWFKELFSKGKELNKDTIDFT